MATTFTYFYIISYTDTFDYKYLIVPPILANYKLPKFKNFNYKIIKRRKEIFRYKN